MKRFLVLTLTFGCLLTLVLGAGIFLCKTYSIQYPAEVAALEVFLESEFRRLRSLALEKWTVLEARGFEKALEVMSWLEDQELLKKLKNGTWS